MEHKYIVIDVDYDKIKAKIIDQSHRGKEFGEVNGKPSEIFKASNNFYLRSFAFVSVSRGIVWMRGSNKYTDNDVLRFEDPNQLKLFVQAIDEYNKHFSNLPNFSKELERILEF